MATVTAWCNGERILAEVPHGPLGVKLSTLPMPLAFEVFEELKQTEDERRAKLVREVTRDGFKDLCPLPGTRREVTAISAIMERAGTDRSTVHILTAENATLSNLFLTVNSPRFLHLATHGLAETGTRVYESALALSQPEQPTPDDDGFLRLSDLLYKWGGKLKGTNLVVLSACDTARGPIESGEGAVALTWGFLFAGSDSVLASLWRVDDDATSLLMKRFYENLLGVFDSPRSNRPARTPMPKAEALAEAKQWLRSLHASEIEPELLAPHRGSPIPVSRSFPESNRPFADPRYWAAFVLIGAPD
jgi:CHAT domain-containing protein